jgi:hypothetical protein
MTVPEDVSAGGESVVNVGLIDLFWVLMKSFPKMKIKLALLRPLRRAMDDLCSDTSNCFNVLFTVHRDISL